MAKKEAKYYTGVLSFAVSGLKDDEQLYVDFSVKCYNWTLALAQNEWKKLKSKYPKATLKFISLEIEEPNLKTCEIDWEPT